MKQRPTQKGRGSWSFGETKKSANLNIFQWQRRYNRSNSFFKSKVKKKRTNLIRRRLADRLRSVSSSWFLFSRVLIEKKNTSFLEIVPFSECDYVDLARPLESEKLAKKIAEITRYLNSIRNEFKEKKRWCP